MTPPARSRFSTLLGFDTSHSESRGKDLNFLPDCRTESRLRDCTVLVRRGRNRSSEVTPFDMTPTVFREGRFRFFFFSREESRIHIHVASGEGEAKFWLEPRLELAKNYRFSRRDLKVIRDLIMEHDEQIRDAWAQHFES